MYYKEMNGLKYRDLEHQIMLQINWWNNLGLLYQKFLFSVLYNNCKIIFTYLD